jgi:hypothetical protein
VRVSGDRNVTKKEAEKILKYKDLTIETQRIWNVKAKVIPVIIGATGTISKSFRKYVNNIPGNHEVKELQKKNHIGHCTRTLESANVEIQLSQRRN